MPPKGLKSLRHRLATMSQTDRNVLSLIGVLVLMWGTTTLGLVWWHWSDTKRSSIGNDHLASAEWAAVVANEAASVLWLTQSHPQFSDVTQTGGTSGLEREPGYDEQA